MKLFIMMAAFAVSGCTLGSIDTVIQSNLSLICDYGEKAHTGYTLTTAFIEDKVPQKVKVTEAKAYVSLRYLCQGDPSKVTAFDIVTRAYQAYVAIEAAKREAASL